MKNNRRSQRRRSKVKVIGVDDRGKVKLSTKKFNMKKIDSIILSGKETLPLIEGGKGIAISSGESSGAWAKAGGVEHFLE